jgi:hypothetical protein
MPVQMRAVTTWQLRSMFYQPEFRVLEREYIRYFTGLKRVEYNIEPEHPMQVFCKQEGIKDATDKVRPGLEVSFVRPKQQG